jgi:hypothetical protein
VHLPSWIFIMHTPAALITAGAGRRGSAETSLARTAIYSSTRYPHIGWGPGCCWLAYLERLKAVDGEEKGRSMREIGVTAEGEGRGEGASHINQSPSCLKWAACLHLSCCCMRTPTNQALC